MDYQQDKIRAITDQLKSLLRTTAMELEGITYCISGYKTDNTPPQGPWLPWGRLDIFSGKDRHYWFHLHFTTPAPQEGKVLYFQMTTGHEGRWDTVNPQGIVYLNGELYQGVDINHTDVLLQPDTEYDMYVYMYTSQIEVIRARFETELVWEDTRVRDLYYDLKVPLDATVWLKSEGEDYWKILRCLEGAVQRLDLRKSGSGAFYESIEEARKYLNEEFYEGVCGGPAPVVHCLGHTHIDVAWLWTLAQTREKAQRSFATVLRLMEQYPEYKFMSSQPQLYQYVKEDAPELYRQIKERAAQGRWEVEGAMWLEADCNLTSGESLVRQILHGKQFMREEFGVDSHILWLPDVFGYSAAMPQILRKSGVDRFFTTKISWNEANKMPYDVFMWEGIDGSEVFTSLGTARDVALPGENDNITTYLGNTEPRQIMGTWERFQQKEYSSQVLSTFGFGDGGGGPNANHLEVQRRMAAGLPGFPRTKIGEAGDFLECLYADVQKRAAETGRMPRWVGELYLEFHRGTYTSIAKNKKNNRKSELLLQKAETLSVLAQRLTGLAYPEKALYDQWQTVLLHQFHDIIPGSSIHEVYEDSDRAYAQVLAEGGNIASTALQALARQVSGSGLLVYNPLGFARSGLVRYGDNTYWAEDVPAMGYKVIEPAARGSQVAASENALENSCYRLTLDEKGDIASLFDKRAGRELCKPGCCLNQLQVFEDFPRDYDAWEVSKYYKDKMWPVTELVSSTVVDDTARRGIRMTKRYEDSSITQTVWLYDASPRIDFETEVDWHQRHQLLKAAFPLDIHAQEATYEIQFGHLTRPTHSNTSWDAMKFEVCAQKWADISEHGYGVALLNDCKYGYSAQGSTLSLSLLKSATYPDPEADQGHHAFTYSLVPHVGDFREAGVIQQAYCLNQPLMAAPASGTQLPETFSLVRCSQENVIIETVKQAQDGNGWILRLYEAFGKRGQAELTFGLPFQKVQLCDLMEAPVEGADISVQGQRVTLPVKNFEIVTLRITV